MPCEVLEAVEPERLVSTFNETWALTWRLVPEGSEARLLLLMCLIVVLQATPVLGWMVPDPVAG